jgi:hypothetical protein
MTPEEIFNLFEGVCPKCGEEVTLIRVSGLPQFMRDNTPENFKGDAHEWLPRLSTDDRVDGSQTFTCKNGHESYVEHTDYGDWQ